MYSQQDTRFFKSKEFGITAGTQYYLGELNQRHFYKASPGFGGYFRINFNRRLGVNTGAWWGRLEGNDADSPDPLKQNRNLHFRSKILEISSVLEINFFKYQIGNEKYPGTPYIFFGLAAFSINPQAKDANGNWVNLQPIGTEGQKLNGGSGYKLINFAVPFGLGIRSNMGKHGAFTVYFGFRKTFTDYIDDVGGVYPKAAEFTAQEAYFVDKTIENISPTGSNEGLARGDNNTLDWYQITGFMISIKMNRKRSACSSSFW